MFYNRNNKHIVQVFSSCETVIEVLKRCRARGKNFGEEMFSTPTHGFLIFFDAYSLNLKIFLTPPPTFDSTPPRP